MEDTFKLTAGYDSLHKIFNDTGVRVVNLPHQKIYLYIRKFINTHELLVEMHTDYPHLGREKTVIRVADCDKELLFGGCKTWEEAVGK
jgi:hypothetical protein